MKVKLLVLAVFFFQLNVSASIADYAKIENSSLVDSVEIERVKSVIVESYVQGIFLEGNYKLVKKGWHSDCDIVLLNKGKLEKLPASYWVERLKKNPKPLDQTVTYRFTDIKITGYASIAVVEIHSHGAHLYTDYMCLYKFDKTWKIVTKIFYTFPAKTDKN